MNDLTAPKGMTISVESAQGYVDRFDCAGDDLAEKSRSLTVSLLKHSPEPLSRNQFTPGHLTCSAVVLHPAERAILLMFHHRFNLWLLPGGHIEEGDATLRDTAGREAKEETLVQLVAPIGDGIVGIDVHGIPAKGAEPYHLHHDLLWGFRAGSEHIAVTEEAPKVSWAREDEWLRFGLAENIRRALRIFAV
jgi:8-oxo-dGTP pyrophosphatase MutT (NUDIX family)